MGNDTMASGGFAARWTLTGAKGESCDGKIAGGRLEASCGLAAETYGCLSWGASAVMGGAEL